MGLFFTGAGSVYGKKKLREGPSSVSSPGDYSFDQTDERPQRTLPFGGGQQQQQFAAQQYDEQQVERPERMPVQQEVPVERTTDQNEEEFLELAEEGVESSTVAPSRPLAATQQPSPVKEHEMRTAPVSKPPISGITKIIVCPKCGSENKGNDRFCYNCGKKLVKETRAKKITPAKVSVKKKVKKKAVTKKPAKKSKKVKKPAKKSSKSLAFPELKI